MPVSEKPSLTSVDITACSYFWTTADASSQAKKILPSMRTSYSEVKMFVLVYATKHSWCLDTYENSCFLKLKTVFPLWSPMVRKRSEKGMSKAWKTPGIQLN